MNSSVQPTPLKKGDVIGIAAPAGQIIDNWRFERGVALLKEMGFEVRFPREMWPGPGYLADTDQNRLKELHSLVADSEVKAIMAARGGYGSLRLASQLDLKVFREQEKALIGFSDISLLLNHLSVNAHMVCFHGPVVTSLADCSRQALQRFYHCLTGQWQSSLPVPKLEILRGEESVSGQLFGGNLSTLMTVFSTPLDFDWTNKVLLLEDIGEPIYRIDRMLSQLALTGKLSKVKAILLGDFTLGPEQDSIEKLRYKEYIWKRVLELTSGESLTVWGNIPSGHCSENLTLPFGATVRLDYNKGALQFL